MIAGNRLYKKMLIIILCISIVNMTDLIQPNYVFSAYTYTQGIGTVQDPYIIIDAEGLDHVRDRRDAHYKLGADIDLTFFDEDDEDVEAGWMPIGSFSEPFRGSFDGAGHVIEGLYIYRPDMKSVGLFGSTTGAHIKNVGLHNVDITGLEIVGGLVGASWDYNGAGSIENCYVTGSVRSAGSLVGGLVGQNFITIVDSYASVNVTGNWEVGGLVGINYGSINKSYATGNVTGSYDVGGLVGMGYYVDNIDGTRLTSDIQNSYATGDVDGTMYIGGLMGANHGSIRNSYAIGDVYGTAVIGGLAGGNEDATFIDSYWIYSTDRDVFFGSSLTSSEMKMQDSYAATWDFDTIWSIDQDQGPGYPQLPPTLVLRSANILADSQELSVVGSMRYGYDEQVFLIKYEIIDNMNMTVIDGFYDDIATGKNQTIYLDLSLSAFSAGNYQLRVWAENAMGLKSEAHTVPFTVEDQTAPTAGNSGNIVATDVMHSSVNLSWDAGTDDLSDANNLQYKVVYSTSNNITSVGDAESNGTIAQNWTMNLTDQTVNGLSASTTYYFNVLVRDEAGNVAIYGGVSRATTLTPTFSIDTIIDQTFTSLTSGYASGTQETKTLTVTRTGTGDLNNLSVVLSGTNADVFELTLTGPNTLTEGTPSTAFTVTTLDGLAEGTYIASITISADHMTSMMFSVTQVVNAPETPETPETLDHPEHLTAVSGDAQVTLNWQTVTGAVYYDVYMSTASGLYSNAYATVTQATYLVSSLTNGTTYYFVVKARNSGSLSESSNEVAAKPEAVPIVSPSPGPNSSSGGSMNMPHNTVRDIIVNGKAERIGFESITETGGRKITTVSVDQEKLEQLIEAAGSISIPIRNGSDLVISEWNGQLIKVMEAKEVDIQLQTERATYTLPVKLIDMNNIANQFGTDVQLQDIQLRIEMEISSDETIQAVERMAEHGGYEVVVLPLSFTITAVYGDRTIPITKFNSYVERMIAIPAGVDPNRITTGVVMDEDGTLRHVPTKIVIVDGKYYVRINSLTNSTYAIIWNPLKFNDVSNHWAEETINDMGARLIVTDNGDNKFSPNREITRAEFAAIVVRAMGLKLDSGVNVFSDVKQSDWYSNVINAAHGQQLINGYPDGTFRPNDRITREQAMVMIAKAMNVTGLNGMQPTVQESTTTLRSYADAEAVSSWAKSSVVINIQANIVSGRSSTVLAPDDYMTRAEVAVIVQRLLQQSGLI